MDLNVSFTSPNAPAEFTRMIRETGFAVLTDHPVPHDLIFETYEEWKRFFASEQKARYAYDRESYWGYYPYLSENAKDQDVKDLKEFFHVFAWSPTPEGMSDRTRRLFETLNGLAETLLGWVDDSTPPEVSARFSMPLRDMIEGSQRTVFRILHYPPLAGDLHPSAVRSSAHEDINLLTLLPAGTAPGLEVKDASGAWVAVACDPSSIIVNSGDMLQEASGGYFGSTTHRVVNPEGERRATSRYSMPLFLHPRPEVRLSERYTAGEYLDERLAEIGLRPGK
jgi:isopenicillin N synthase-like dioxygenase